MLKLMRCDDRLIHGQCTTVLVQEHNIRAIVVVDDEAANNPILRTVYETAASGIPTTVCTVAKAEEKVRMAMESPTATLLLVKQPQSCLALMNKVEGLPQQLNIGPMSKRPGTVAATRTIHLLPEEAHAIEELTQKGVRVYFQQVPTEKAVEWSEVRAKFIKS